MKQTLETLIHCIFCCFLNMTQTVLEHDFIFKVRLVDITKVFDQVEE